MDARNLHVVDHVTARLTVFIHPSYAQQVEKGVKTELDQHLLRYMEDQEAVLLAYANVKVLSKQALLSNYFPYLTIHCTADLVLLKPNPGEILVGRVHSLSAGMLGILVLGGINARVSAEEMPEGFHFNLDHNCWALRGDYTRAIMIGDYVACKVLSAPVVDPEGEELLFTLDASLLADEAGLLEQQPPEQQQKRAALAAAAEAEGIMGTCPGQHAQQPPMLEAGASLAHATETPSSKEEKRRAKEEKRRAKEEKRRAREERRQRKLEKKAAKRKQPAGEAAAQPPSKRHKHVNSSNSSEDATSGHQQQLDVQQQQQQDSQHLGSATNGLHDAAVPTPKLSLQDAQLNNEQSHSKRKHKHKQIHSSHKKKHKDKH